MQRNVLHFQLKSFIFEIEKKLKVERCDGSLTWDKIEHKLRQKAECDSPEIDKPTPGVNFINMLMRSFYAPKCCGSQLLFHQQNYAQLYRYALLEVTLNFYPVRSTP